MSANAKPDRAVEQQNMLLLICKARRAFAIGLLTIAIALLSFLLFSQREAASAQDVPPDVLRMLQQRQSGTGDDGTQPTRPTVQTFQPVVPQQLLEPSSPVELVYQKRSGQTLNQIGYETLGSPAAVSVVQTGALQDSYVLGVGDELVFELRGQENSSYRQRVSRSGGITLPKLNPIAAAGRTLGDFRRSLEAEVSRAYVSTTVFITLGETHQVSVLVTGYVRTPGMRVVSALSSPVDAILLSGGISKAGSLRNVQLIRNGTVRIIDLYSLVLRGAPVRLGMLQDGDRIYVAPLGSTVAVTGSVKQPGIYELSPGAAAINATELIALSGGTIIANAYDLSKIMLDTSGATSLVPILRTDRIRSGEIVFVRPTRTANADRVSLIGAVQEAGVRPLATTRSTADLFHSTSDLLAEAYAPFALILRRDAKSNASSFIPFSIVRALAHDAPIALQSNDRVFVFTLDEIRALTRIVTKASNAPYPTEIPSLIKAGGDNGNSGTNGTSPPNGATYPGGTSPTNGMTLPDGTTPSQQGYPGAANASTPGATLATGSANAGSNRPVDPRATTPRGASTVSDAFALAQAMGRTETGAGGPIGTGEPLETDDQIANRIAIRLNVPRLMLENAVSEQMVWVLDQVHMPGAYAAGPGSTLKEMIDAAGGALGQADLSSVEVTSTEVDRLRGISRTARNSYGALGTDFQVVSIRPLDVVRVRPMYTGRSGESVTVLGEVRYPGVFDITSGERLSSVLQRAGGLTEFAYPYGAVFTRRSAALHEREGNERIARELEEQLTFLAAKPTDNNTQQPNYQFLLTLAQQARDAPTLGRVVVTADPVVLASRPELDVMLDQGDALYIPKRPSNISVVGEVLSPGFFQYRPSVSYAEYLRMAGGLTQVADDNRIFIVMPDGTAVPTEQGWLTFSDAGHIPPGATIVVPRDLRPFDWGAFLKDASQIFSQLAVAAASLAVLHSNN